MELRIRRRRGGGGGSKFRFFERERRRVVVFGRKVVSEKIKGGSCWFDEEWTVRMVLKLSTVSSMDIHVAT